MFAALIALVAFAGSATAALRSPQVVFASGGLQGYLNSVGESINCLTDQNDVQLWNTTISNNSTFTLQIELSSRAATNTIGIYNDGPGSPPLYQVFPGAATAGWFATASFKTSPTRVVVNLFDNNAVLQGSNIYAGAVNTNFGYYLFGSAGFVYTQDARNLGGFAQALTYAGTGGNAGSWWLCFEEQRIAQGQSDQDYNDAVLFLESVNPTPVSTTSWGQVKARFIH
jgi:hypothetical protein